MYPITPDHASRGTSRYGCFIRIIFKFDETL